MAELNEGDNAPAFALQNQAGETVTLEGLRGHKALVYFYPKADTPGCTKQSCALRDIAGQVGDTAIIGISPDPPRKQARFDEKYGLGFPLLADEDHSVAEAYGTWAEKSMYGRKYMGILRSAFLIDETGRIAKAWYKVSPADTATNLLESL
ncbi:MAG TPA: thioredoxin-dependent thiol peroxidase [Acidimicrobiales bacterium]|nr:thioredoxin-dependent thiol peroxidase [Acidimicrobiales bacterium]